VLIIGVKHSNKKTENFFKRYPRQTTALTKKTEYVKLKIVLKGPA